MQSAKSSADILEIVLNSTSRLFVSFSQELEQLLEEEKLAGVPVLVFANKQDLVTAASSRDVADALCLDKLRDRSWNIQACSALTSEGLEVCSPSFSQVMFKNIKEARMHSSRMRTVQCSGRLGGGGVWLRGVYIFPGPPPPREQNHRQV